MLTRRQAVAGLAAPIAAAALPRAARALSGPPDGGQTAGFARFGLGDFRITILSDGYLPRSTALYALDPGEETLRAFLEARRQPTETAYAHCNHVLIETGEATVLADVGAGDRFLPSEGRLLENMEAAEIDPSDVTHLALTHAHPDHCWGMMDDFGDEKRLPEAEVSIGAAEFDWWMKEGRVDDVPEADQAMVVGAQNALGAVAEEIRLVKDGDAIVSGVSVMATPGHTHGHQSLLVESGSERLLVLGDALVDPYVSFERPDWRYGRDHEQDLAAATRRRVLDMAAADDIAIVGYHLPFPGVGFVAREGDAYRFIPATIEWG